MASTSSINSMRLTGLSGFDTESIGTTADGSREGKGQQGIKGKADTPLASGAIQ